MRDKSGRRYYIEQSDATLVTRRKPPFTLESPAQKWIVFSITRGTLVAYVGTTPVFATLASPGVGGVPRPGRNPVKYSTTPLGTYLITFKHRNDDMSPDEGDDRKFWLADVPYAQYFAQPFAIHVAYWHEDFGEPMSAGCINVSPRDGQWLFDWTDPELPPGWSAVGVSPATGKGTRLVVTR
jgi:lipoprotein-anchoring transpeptidase ErfK/SrfK